jgi:hypothetical protein
MDNLFRVEIGDSRNELGEKLAGHRFSKMLVGKNVFEELASARVFEDDPNEAVSLDDFVEPDNVWMFDHLRVAERRKWKNQYDRTMEIWRVWQSRSCPVLTLSTSISRWTFIDRALFSMLPFLMSLMATSSPHLCGEAGARTK